MEHIEEYRKAGKVAAGALREGAKGVKVGARLIDVAEAVEAYIVDSGAKWAFPCNISVNNQAAHYTPGIDDAATFGKDVVKLDCGAHVDGFIGDTAMTIDLTGENGKLVEASEKALEAAIAAIKPGVHSNEIGREIGKTIMACGFKPVHNLGGHVLGEYELHTGHNIPNVDSPSGFELEEGDAIAIEPFASTGRGDVREQSRVEIFSIGKLAQARNSDARNVLEYAVNEFGPLPFAERWLTKACSGFKLKVALRELIQREIFKSYPVLADSGLVSQAEHTIVVTAGGCEVTTK